MPRYKVQIKWETVDKLLQAGASGCEVASMLGISEDTLYKRCRREKKMNFEQYKFLKRSTGAGLLKLKQFQLAMDGNISMLVWLGKQYLSQTDKGEVKIVEQDKFSEKYDLRKLQPDELKQLKELLKKAEREYPKSSNKKSSVL